MTDSVKDMETAHGYFLKRMEDCKERFAKHWHQAVCDSQRVLPGRNIRAATEHLRLGFGVLQRHEMALIAPVGRNKGLELRRKCDVQHRIVEVWFCERLRERFDLTMEAENRIWALSERRLADASMFRRSIRLAFDTSQFIIDDVHAKAGRGNASELQYAIRQGLTSYIDTVFTDELRVDS